MKKYNVSHVLGDAGFENVHELGVWEEESALAACKNAASDFLGPTKYWEIWKEEVDNGYARIVNPKEGYRGRWCEYIEAVEIEDE